MPTLFVLSGPLIGRSFEVAGEVLVGRTPECDVPLAAPSISRRHARLAPEGGTWVLHDLDSRNGIFSGELRVQRLELSDGDVFRLGDVELRFRLAGEPAPQPEPRPGPPPRVEPPPMRAPAPTSPPAPAPARAEELDPGEIVLEDADAGPAASLPPRPAARAVAPRPLPPSPSPSPTGVARRGAPLAPDVRRRDERPLLQYHRVADRGGPFTADLSQYPAWLRVGAVLLALALFAGIFWFAFRGTSALKGRLSGPGAVEVEGPR